MVNILEIHYDIGWEGKGHNYQTQIIQCESFKDYCKLFMIGEAGVPEHFEIANKEVDLENEELLRI